MHADKLMLLGKKRSKGKDAEDFLSLAQNVHAKALINIRRELEGANIILLCRS